MFHFTVSQSHICRCDGASIGHSNVDIQTRNYNHTKNFSFRLKLCWTSSFFIYNSSNELPHWLFHNHPCEYYINSVSSFQVQHQNIEKMKKFKPQRDLFQFGGAFLWILHLLYAPNRPLLRIQKKIRKKPQENVYEYDDKWFQQLSKLSSLQLIVNFHLISQYVAIFLFIYFISNCSNDEFINNYFQLSVYIFLFNFSGSRRLLFDYHLSISISVYSSFSLSTSWTREPGVFDFLGGKN